MEQEQQSQSVSEVYERSRKRIKIIFTILVTLIILFAAGATYFYLQVKKGTSTDQSAAAIDANKKELADTIAAVGKLILLPTGETPTLATVSDPSKLQDQAFFANAQVGDVVLIYTQAKQAILYRPSKNLIIEVAPVNVGPPQNATPVPLESTTPGAPTTQTVTPLKLNQTGTQ